MKLRKFVALALAVSVIFSLSACGSASSPTSDELSAIPVAEILPEPEPEFVINPLTGEEDLKYALRGTKPVSVSVNNTFVAQPVQCGLDKADVVFEAEVEGGITRLLAVFSDPSELAQVGTIRSLRVPFAQIACGMDSILFYHGIDRTYCAPYLRTLPMQAFVVDAKVYGFRQKNGLAYEHTLYTTGEKIQAVIRDKGYNYTSSREGTWLNFNTKKKPIIPSETVANQVSVPFSNAFVTQFMYDEGQGKYIRAKNGVPFKDKITGNYELFSNVFILKTSVSYYPDGYHRQIALSSGSGYYVSQGRIVEILWSKGKATDNFSFFNADGTALTVNRGNSYVCIINKTRNPSFS